MGNSSCPRPASQAQSLRHALAILSLTCSIVRLAIHRNEAGNRGGHVLRSQFSTAGFRPDPLRIPSALDLSRVSVLGGNSYGAVDSAHYGEHVLPPAAPGHSRKTADWIACSVNSSPAKRRSCVPGCRPLELLGNAKLDFAVAGTHRGLLAIHTTAGASGPAFGGRPPALLGS